MNRAVMHHPLAAIACLITGQWTLSVLDGTGKWLLLAGMALPLLIVVRFFVQLVFTTVWMTSVNGPRIWHTRAPKLQLVRGALLIASTFAFFSVLRVLPLAEATALNFTSPLIVVALSRPLLGEHVSASRWIAVAVGFVGMLVIVRPGSDLPTHGVLLGLMTATIFATFHIATRKVSTFDRPETTLLWSGSVSTVCAAAVFAASPPTELPVDSTTLALLLTTGLTGSLGHYLLLQAYRRAPASLLSPFVYAQIIAALTMGWLLFDQLPDRLTFVGIAIIAGSGIYAAWQEARVSRQAALDAA